MLMLVLYSAICYCSYGCTGIWYLGILWYFNLHFAFCILRWFCDYTFTRIYRTYTNTRTQDIQVKVHRKYLCTSYLVFWWFFIFLDFFGFLDFLDFWILFLEKLEPVHTCTQLSRLVFPCFLYFSLFFVFCIVFLCFSFFHFFFSSTWYTVYVVLPLGR